MKNGLLLLGISANQAVLICLLVFAGIMLIYAFAKIFNKQWLAFWGMIFGFIGRFAWWLRYIVDLFKDSLCWWSSRKYRNRIKRYETKLSMMESSSPKYQKVSALLEKNRALLAAKELKETLSFGEVADEKALVKVDKRASFIIAKKQQKIAKFNKKIEVSEKKYATLINQSQLDFQKEYYQKLNNFYKGVYLAKIRACQNEIDFQTNFKQLNKKARKSYYADKRVKRQHLVRDSYESRRAIVLAYRVKRHHKLNKFCNDRKQNNSAFAENVRNKYAHRVHRIDGAIREWESENAILNVLIKIGAGIVNFLLVFVKLLAALLRDIVLGVIGLFGVTLPVFFARLPIRFLYFFTDVGRKLVYGFIVFFTMELKQNLRGYIYLLPVLILLIIFTFYPIINTFILSFMQGYIMGTGQFEAWSFDGYINILNDPYFATALKNTFFLVFVSVPLAVVVALLISVGLNSIKRLQGLLQTIFFLPYLTNTIATGMVFSVIFADGKFGLVNQILGLFGMNPVNFHTGASWGECMIVIISYSVWSALAFKIMVFLSGMQNINKQYYQAAKIDGTPKVRTFFKITVPMISPMIAYVTITSFIGTFKAYTSIIALYGDKFGPPGQTGNKILITVVGLIMEQLRESGSQGAMTRASAGSVILLAIIMMMTGVQMYISNKKVHY